MFWKTLVCVTAMAAVACGGDDSDNGSNPGGSLSDATGGCAGVTNCINLDISEDQHLTGGTWTLSPKNAGGYVTVRDGVTLTIDPGTTIVGLQGSALVVERGAKLMAEGTASSPIVFTSARDVGSRLSADWGGVLLLGKAPVNEASPHFEGMPATDTTGDYGGDELNDSSGSLKYVRIEFAGYTYAPDKEFNALTLCGVGRGTTIDYVQLHRSSDDGIEFFGGTVDVKHIVSSQNQDDGFDTDSAWSGRGQFIVVQHINGQSSDPNGYESDNRADGQDYNATPRTNPTIYNATLIGSAATATASRGAVIRRGAAGLYVNQIFDGFRDSAVDIRDAATTALWGSSLKIQSSIFYNNHGGDNWQDETSGNANNDAGFVEATELLAPALGNAITASGLSSASRSVTAPDFRTATLLPGATPPADGFFDTSATFIGGVGATDWTAGWTTFVEN